MVFGFGLSAIVSGVPVVLVVVSPAVVFGLGDSVTFAAVTVAPVEVSTPAPVLVFGFGLRVMLPAVTPVVELDVVPATPVGGVITWEESEFVVQPLPEACVVVKPDPAVLLVLNVKAGDPNVTVVVLLVTGPLVVTTVVVRPVLVCLIATCLPLLQLQLRTVRSVNITEPLPEQTFTSTCDSGVVSVLTVGVQAVETAYAGALYALFVLLVVAPSVLTSVFEYVRVRCRIALSPVPTPAQPQVVWLPPCPPSTPAEKVVVALALQRTCSRSVFGVTVVSTLA